MNRPLIGFVLLVSFSGLAQNTSITPPPPPPPEVASADAPRTDPDDGGRVRWGINAQVGVFLPQPAVMFGAEGRIGYQINRTFNAHLNIGGNFGFGVGAAVNKDGTVGSAGINVVGYWAIGLMGEATLGDHFNIAVGPALASGGWAGVSVGASSTSGSVTTVAAGGWMPGVDARLSLSTGGRNPHNGRRSGFNIGINVLTVFAPNAVYTHTEAGTNGASVDVQTNGLAVGIVPTLTLGFDSR